MTPDVIKVVPSSDYSIVAEFNTGEMRRFDMRPYLDFPAYVALKELGLFMRAHVENGTVVWNEEIDLSPDTLYLRGLPQQQQQQGTDHGFDATSTTTAPAPPSC